jgi:hypothetical protein
LLESVGVAPVERGRGLVVAAPALVAAAGALLLLNRECRVGRWRHNDSLSVVLAQFVPATERGRAVLRMAAFL